MIEERIAALVSPYVSVFTGHEIGDFVVVKDGDRIVVEDIDGKWRLKLCPEGKSVISVASGSGPVIAHVNRGTGCLYAVFHDFIAFITRKRVILDDVPMSNLWIEFVAVEPEKSQELLELASQAKVLAMKEAGRRRFEPGIVMVHPENSSFVVLEDNVWRANVEDGKLTGWGGFPIRTRAEDDA